MSSHRGRSTLRSLISLTAVLLVVAVVVLAPSATQTSQAHADALCTVSGTGSLCQDSDGWQWIYDSSRGSFDKVRRSSSRAPDGATYVYLYAPSCDRDTPDTTELCGRALAACDVTDPGAIYYDVWRQETAPVPGPPIIEGAVCLGGVADTVTVAQLAVGVDEDIRDHLPTFAVRAQPSPVAVVNLPVLVSAPAEPAPDFAVANPVPGRVTVTSTYTWTFDDGATLVGTGRAYDGTDPRTATPGYYLAHTYDHADADAFVTLVVSWHATFSVEGGPPVALPDIVTAPQQIHFQVHEVRALLVSG